MNTKQIATILLVSMTLVALLGCVTQPPASPGDEQGSDDEQPGEELVGPEYYGSETDALAALDEELEAMGDLSSEDLDALLGE